MNLGALLVSPRARSTVLIPAGTSKTGRAGLYFERLLGQPDCPTNEFVPAHSSWIYSKITQSIQPIRSLWAR